MAAVGAPPNEAIVGDSDRGLCGVSFAVGSIHLSASAQSDTGLNSERSNAGFRVAIIPEPSTGLLVIAGLLVLAGQR
jgi:hypothetical protein